MTNAQKIIVSKLLEGCSIAAMGPGAIRLRDQDGHPILKINGATFYWLRRNLLRKHKGVFLINKSKMRQFHGNSFVKKIYKGMTKAPPAQITPPPMARRRMSALMPHYFFNLLICITQILDWMRPRRPRMTTAKSPRGYVSGVARKFAVASVFAFPTGSSAQTVSITLATHLMCIDG